MAFFRYVGRDHDWKLCKGTIEAKSKNEAITDLENLGIKVQKINGRKSKRKKRNMDHIPVGLEMKTVKASLSAKITSAFFFGVIGFVLFVIADGIGTEFTRKMQGTVSKDTVVVTYKNGRYVGTRPYILLADDLKSDLIHYLIWLTGTGIGALYGWSVYADDKAQTDYDFYDFEE